MNRSAILFLLLTLAGPQALAADEALRSWPAWRGPLGTGVAPHGRPPVSWSETENVRFKVELPGRGLSTPVIWADRLFLLAAIPADAKAYEESRSAAAAKSDWPPSVEPVPHRFVVLALDRTTGKTLWERTAAELVPHEAHHIDASWASASPVTDGKRLIAHFGSQGTYAYDLDGNLLWKVDLGDAHTRNHFGEGSSPALHDDTVVITWDQEEGSFLVALDADTGEERWRANRPDEVTTWATPLIAAELSRPQVVVPGSGHSRGYDLRSGEEIWRASGLTANVIPSPLRRENVVYLTSGYRGTMLQAIDLARAKGTVNDTEAMRWTYDQDTPYVPSLLLSGDRLYVLKHLKNILTVLDARDGEVLVPQTRIEGLDGVWASPVAAGGRVYVLGRDGTTAVLRDTGEYEVLATNRLDDHFDASPAIVDDTLYLRGTSHLYALAAAP